MPKQFYNAAEVKQMNRCKTIRTAHYRITAMNKELKKILDV
ncbi:hypothetical protein [Jeotgalibacillus proteolyticus]|nr:hypothetical protein [Jeotgalibacillus proteolyticus]